MINTPNKLSLVLRTKYINKIYGHPLQVIDYIENIAWLGIWSDSKLDPEAIADYLKTDNSDIALVAASSCTNFPASILKDFSYMVRVTFKTPDKYGKLTK
jgi:hypothetical protein